MATIALSSRYGSKLAYDTGIGVNSIGFFAGKFLPRLVFWFVLRIVLVLDVRQASFVADLGVAFMDD